MFRKRITFYLALLCIFATGFAGESETLSERDARMKWWREARFGLFIHWGLYAIPAGEWGGGTGYGEWIRTSAQMPLNIYDQFIGQFNPQQFNADEWVRMTKNAGMKYIVITSKHHDGFCLFDSKYTDFDVMSTPFKRDILKELAAACQKEGIKMCWYHSIMDWHHPDYLPRREWEKDRPTEGANFNRYVEYMKSQLKELLTNYGDIGVLWFDGEWEATWNSKYGWETYDYVRGLQPKIIVNNRVGAGRSGMAGFTKTGEFSGDFGTPEQEIPATGTPGRDWETCMTMNDHWGYNKNDQNWKSADDLIKKLVDIASKGGNFLLNVGPTPEGLLPQASIDRLQEIGRWMAVNGEAITATQASPFKHLEWGRCTQKEIVGGTRMYLHVFNWPADGKLIVPNMYNQPLRAFLLANSKKDLPITQMQGELLIDLPKEAPDSTNSVVAVDLVGKADIGNPPEITAEFDIFVDKMNITFTSEREHTELRYTTDGSNPVANSKLYVKPIALFKNTTVSVRCFRDGKPVSGLAQKKFVKVYPKPAVMVKNVQQGLHYAYYEGDWDQLPNFDSLALVKKGILPNFNFFPRKQVEHFGFVYSGYIRIPKDGVYELYTDSDDGSRLYLGDDLLVDNDGLHGMTEKGNVVALAKGFHPLRVTYFEKTGGDDLLVSIRGFKMAKQVILDEMLAIEKEK